MCECGTPDDAPGPARRPARVDQEAGQSAGHTHTRTLMGTRCGPRARGVGVSDLVFLVLVFGACVTAGHRTHRASGGDSGADAGESEHPLVAQFWTRNQSLALQHMVYNRGAGVLYVGGTNRLWALGVERLELRAQVETGPRFDSPRCHASGCGPERRVARVLTDNVNKVLVLDPEASTLIMCGSVSQGACEKFRTANISLTPEFLPRSVAANDPESSTYAFVGPERYNPWGGSSALYVGTTFTTVGDYRHDVPAISTRNLYNLDYAEFSFSEQSLLRIDVKYRDHFLVQYVYGFNASDYAYFVTVQKKSHLPGQEESGYISRLARTCISDANYDSYTEITLECQGADGTNYNLVQDAKLVSAGSDLASSMGVGVGDPILVGVFAPSQGHTASPQASSAAKFNENIHMCFNGSMQYRSMEYISGPILDGKCPAAGTMGNIFNFCEVGLKISGVSPIHSRAALLYRNTSLTAVQAATTAHHTVLFLGTTTGSLKKALLAGPEDAAEYGEDVIDAGSRVLPDLVMDASGTHLFVLTTTKSSTPLPLFLTPWVSPVSSPSPPPRVSPLSPPPLFSRGKSCVLSPPTSKSSQPPFPRVDEVVNSLFLSSSDLGSSSPAGRGELRRGLPRPSSKSDAHIHPQCSDPAPPPLLALWTQRGWRPDLRPRTSQAVVKSLALINARRPVLGERRRESFDGRGAVLPDARPEWASEAREGKCPLPPPPRVCAYGRCRRTPDGGRSSDPRRAFVSLGRVEGRVTRRFLIRAYRRSGKIDSHYEGVLLFSL
ncbi:hypothetical protein C7M84_015601 [Penaeus vannamei]|uniref:Sema domain-containing protein n=1 Tax=Penaeus vannamei TaxID=6689 RepID=A0A3R7SLZ7_PENVA|nr:hypothetical protein C7M84_015601 [Penaeus vannamei]